MSSVLLIGGEDPLGAQLATRLARLGHDVAATVRPHARATQVSQALSHRGVEVYLCNPDDPLSLSSAVAGREELYLCLQAERPLNQPLNTQEASWGGVGRDFGSLLLNLSARRPNLEADPFRAHERSAQRAPTPPKSPLSVTLEASALSSTQAPKVTLLCSMFALAPQRPPLDQQAHAHPPLLYQAPSPPPSATSRQLLARLSRLLFPRHAPRPPSWKRAHQALREASVLDLPCVFHALPYHEQRLLSASGDVELLSWLQPQLVSCAPLEDLATGLILLRAHSAKGRPVDGGWFLGGDNIKLDLLEETLKVTLSDQQLKALSPSRDKRRAHGADQGWTLSSHRARATLGYEWHLRRAHTDERPLYGR